MAAPPTQLHQPNWTSREVASLLAEARQQQEQLKQELAQLDQLERESLELGASARPWDPETQTAVAQVRQQLPQQQRRVQAQLAHIGSLLDDARQLDPTNTIPSSKLAELHWLMFSRAEERGEAELARHHLGQVALHDDGRFADLVEGTATLQVETNPAGATVELEDLERGTVTALGPTPVDPVDVAPGNYRLRIRLTGHAPTLRPLSLPRGSDLQVHVRLFASREVGPDYRVIPAGRFTYGGDTDAPGSGASEQPFVDNFALARTPVTQGEYMLFLDAQSESDPGLALRYAPLATHGSGHHDPRLPVTGVSLEAAQAYCRWLTARTGQAHRLPTEQEWEKAARGVDRRRFPWGNTFDATRCHMRRSRPGAPIKTAVGTVAGDESVYGVLDMAGGVAEWTTSAHATDPELVLVRGGAYDTDSESCRCAARLPCPPTAQPNLGFRLVRELAPGGGERFCPAMVPSLASEPTDAAMQPARLPGHTPRSTRESLEQVGNMASRLAQSTEPCQVLGELMAETVELLRAERALLLRGAQLEVIEGRRAQGDPVPSSDQSFDEDVVRAALKQSRSISLAHPHPMLALPLPDGQTCLLLERRFQRDRRFTDDQQLIAESAAEPLALALRLCGR